MWPRPSELSRGRGMNPCTPALNVSLPVEVSIDASDPSTPLKVAEIGSRSTAMPLTLSSGRSSAVVPVTGSVTSKPSIHSERFVRPRAADAELAVAAAHHRRQQRQRLQDVRPRRGQAQRQRRGHRAAQALHGGARRGQRRGHDFGHLGRAADDQRDAACVWPRAPWPSRTLRETPATMSPARTAAARMCRRLR